MVAITKDAYELAPWIENPYRLVSLGEILMINKDAEGYPLDEILFGRFHEVSYFLGVLDHPPLTQNNIIGMTVIGELAAKDMTRWGFFGTAQAVRNLVKMLEGKAPVMNLPAQIMVVRQILVTELETRVFVPVTPEHAHFYREPRRDWEAVIKRFDNSTSDIEEAGKCYALGRYTASVFHCMLVVESALVELGQSLGMQSNRPSWGAVRHTIEQIIQKADRTPNDLTDFQHANLGEIRQIHTVAAALESAWRNKVDHAGERLAIFPDATIPETIAREIMTASQSFSRRLAEFLPARQP